MMLLSSLLRRKAVVGGVLVCCVCRFLLDVLAGLLLSGFAEQEFEWVAQDLQSMIALQLKHGTRLWGSSWFSEMGTLEWDEFK